MAFDERSEPRPQGTPRRKWFLLPGLPALVCGIFLGMSALLVGIGSLEPFRRTTDLAMWWPQALACFVLALGALDLGLLSILAFRRFDPTWPEPREDRTVRIAACAVPVWILLSMILVSIERPIDRCAVAKRQCINNVRQMSTILSERSHHHGWPPAGGRAFVLSLLADGILDADSPYDRNMFVCPFHPDPSTPGGNFTSYAGRRNDEDAYRLTLEVLKAGPEPILACLHHEGGAIVGYADGWARFLDQEALGLGPDDPIVVGEASKSPILLKLSHE